MPEVPSAVEIYHRVIDCRELDITGSDLFQRDASHDTPQSPKYRPHTSTTALQLQVKLELGHHATLRLKPTFEGYTHDWEVFLRSPEGAGNCQIHHFVKRVEFHLHQSFSRQKIVQKEPPFKLNESGYAGFVLPIDVYFRNPGHPKKIRFLYDLTLDRRRSTIHIRCEKLTFRNPPEIFRSLLIKGGGQLVRRKRRLNTDTGLAVGSALLGRSLDVKPSLRSSGIEADLSPSQQITTDSKEWFKIKQEAPETPQQLNQNKENQPQGSVSQSKSSVSFLQDWLRNICSSKQKQAKRWSLEIGLDPSGTVTSSEQERASFSSGIFSADSWISEGKGHRGGAGGSESCISEGKRATGGASWSDSCVSDKRVTDSGTAGKGRDGERRGLREMKQINGNWDSPMSSVRQPFAIKLKIADRRNEASQIPVNSSRKSSSRRGRNPTKFVQAVPVSCPSSYTHHPQTTAMQEQTTTNKKTLKTKTDILNSNIRRRLLKVKGHSPPVQGAQRLPRQLTTSVSGIRFQIDQSQALKNSTVVSGVVSPIRIQRRGPGRPRKNPLVPRPEKLIPTKRKRGRPAGTGPGVRTRNAGNPIGNPRGNERRNSKEHMYTGAPNSSDEDDVVFVGYSPPKQEPQNDAEYGIPRQVSAGRGTTSGHARKRSVGRPKKAGRKRSTQLELLKSATEEFVGNAGGSGLQTEERVRNESSGFAEQPDRGGKGKRKIGRVSRSGFEVVTRLPSLEARTEDFADQNPRRRKKLRIVPVRCGSDNEDDEDTGVSDLSVEYPSEIYQSSTLLRSSNSVSDKEKPAHGSRGTAHSQKSAPVWMTSTPVKPKPPAVRQRSIAGQAAKRRNKEDVAWSRYGQNAKQSKRGRPRKVPQTAALTRQSDDLMESVDPLTPCSDHPIASPEVVTVSGESVSVLMELQQRLATLADGQLLKRVVQIVEESGLYQLDDAMFDFDLCNLDKPTIEKLKVCLR